MWDPVLPLTHYHLNPRESPAFIALRVSFGSPNHTSGIALLLCKPLPAFARDKGSLQLLQLIKSKLSFGLSCFQKQNKGQPHSREYTSTSLRLPSLLIPSFNVPVPSPTSAYWKRMPQVGTCFKEFEIHMLTFHLLEDGWSVYGISPHRRYSLVASVQCQEGHHVHPWSYSEAKQSSTKWWWWLVVGGGSLKGNHQTQGTSKSVRPAPQWSAGAYANSETQDEVTHRPMNVGSPPAVKKTIINIAH